MRLVALHTRNPMQVQVLGTFLLVASMALLVSPSPAAAFSGLLASKAYQNEPAADLFRQSEGPYVPSGLTAKEYEKIKATEKARLAKMNFGAWGPRFQRTGVPQGDWMVMPKLWTAGFDSNNGNKEEKRGVSNGKDKGASSRINLPIAALRRNAIPLLVCYLLVDLLLVGWTIARFRPMSGVAGKNLFASAVLRTLLPLHHRASLLGAKMVTSAALLPLAQIYENKMNRKHLWSRRRAFGVALASAVVPVAALFLCRTLLPI